jgi:hypothetical protein
MTHPGVRKAVAVDEAFIRAGEPLCPEATVELIEGEAELLLEVI